MVEPLFILCPGRSFSSVICGMLGEHPQMYGLPELHLFIKDTVKELIEMARFNQGRKYLVHGLYRTIAQLHYGEQTEETVSAAMDWIEKHNHWSTHEMFYYLQKTLHPKICVDKSPTYAVRLVNLARLHSAFPDARFLHVARHPRATCNSMFKFYSAKIALGRGQNISYDPLQIEREWRKTHENILRFTRQLHPGQSMLLQGEALFSDLDNYLYQIAEWLDVRSDSKALDAMKHPENSPYACVGPPNARGGNNLGYMENPALKKGDFPEQNLDDPLEYLEDGSGFTRETIDLARQLGYP